MGRVGIVNKWFLRLRFAFGRGEPQAGKRRTVSRLRFASSRATQRRRVMGMVIAHHLVWTPYGCSLPIDPRGSSSHEVLVEALARLGELHYGRHPIRPSREQLREFHDRAQEVLSYPVMTFDEGDVSVIAESFGNTIRERGYTC